MNTPYIRAPHAEAPPTHNPSSGGPNAALLVDFDNVTMGMRSDLSKELKSLLRSDIIKGKVTVQRAYADWRRYPQYIVPLSEASIDLIFAPAYGSSKKNATDIRMAIDGMELVFTRPEIGTFILLTGDSDFSSLVLKLKEYGKYVIGVGIQESSSDILVQNCDEYYSYTAITGLRKSGEDGVRSGLDPWVLAEKAVDQMIKRKDVMRSDRLKQVMLELDPGFDEKSLGFSKFSRFLTEAAQKGLLQLRKLENGQYEVSRQAGGSPETRAQPAPAPPRERGRGTPTGERKPPRGRRAREEPPPSRDVPAPEAGPAAAPPAGGGEKLAPAYDLLVRAVRDLLDDADGDASVRDSDVKRRMLAIQESWDEAEFGFSKFSLFLRQAHDHEVIDLRKGQDGNYEVALPSGRTAAAAEAPGAPPKEPPPPEPTRKAAPSARKTQERPSDEAKRRLRPRLSGRRRNEDDAPPPLLEGQAVPAPSTRGSGRDAAPRKPSGEVGEMDLQALRLPTERGSVVQYLSNSYKGVGEKTAEALVDALGDRLFPTLRDDAERIRKLLPAGRAEKLLEAWEADYSRRLSRLREEQGSGSKPTYGTAATPETAAPVETGIPDGNGSGARPRGGRRTRGSGRSSR